MASKKSIKVHDEKVVPFPKALCELQQVAQLTFKVDAKMKLWHHGEQEIKFSKDYEKVRDGDLVEVWTNKRSPFPNQGDRSMQSTLHADFVHHPYDKPPKAKKDDASVLTEDQMKGQFEDATIYKGDYTKKPLTARGMYDTGGPKYAQHFLHHAGNNSFDTTYKDHYVKHPVDSKSENNFDIRSSTLTSMSKGRRFNATTSYDKDFNKKRPTLVPDRQTGIGNDSTLTNAVRECPFDAASIYQESYLEHPFCKEPGIKPMGAARGKHAFNGNSEYKEQYYKKAMNPRIRLRHVEQWEF
mmetsp:Transcript_878/g.1702  ORF Transcript_878/g.1702 Transcript_878/m.1702 type:complete len:298 (-) Transcript_878:164-1057(-)